MTDSKSTKRKIAEIFLIAALGVSAVGGSLAIAATKANDWLMYAARHDMAYAINPLIALGADIHTQQDSPLTIAAGQGYTDMVAFFLNRGADIHTMRDLPVKVASLMGHTETVRFLLDRGADISVDDFIAIGWADNAGYEETKQLLCGRARNIERAQSSLNFKKRCPSPPVNS